MSTTQAIRELIAAQPTGEPFTPSLFAEVGSRASIDQALTRFCKSGHIERIGHGLYLVPRINRFGLKVMPSAEVVARTVAKVEGAQIEIHGAEAARRFGFTTQMPVQPVFYTSGTTRNIQLGKMTLRLQHVAARKLVLAGRLAGQALSALWYLGRHQVSQETIACIKEKLPVEEFQALCNAKSAMPFWMIEALNQYEKQGSYKS
ncbi:hypothetical protein L579_3533 [Pantoea sp. AS-PWVM4]|uniref:DUF6088 family protein n=1 Tax=Pantoea sp. AS-PWVM4 TaxID=1332069 RepID=UPI0003AC871C|nr:DUF6088 family protein [Pantoea sp. AS-PWVM4]ERK17652.1 hypothetical protein L579_3533 [Pantoea sp. AS-PWVM4]